MTDETDTDKLRRLNTHFSPSGLWDGVDGRSTILTAADEIESLRARLVAAEKINAAMAQHDAANQRGYIQSRRSICEQSDRYKAEKDAAEASLARVTAAAKELYDYLEEGLGFCDCSDGGSCITPPEQWELDRLQEALGAVLATPAEPGEQPKGTG